MLTNNHRCFFGSQSFETGFSDFHHMAGPHLSLLGPWAQNCLGPVKVYLKNCFTCTVVVTALVRLFMEKVPRFSHVFLLSHIAVKFQMIFLGSKKLRTSNRGGSSPRLGRGSLQGGRPKYYLKKARRRRAKIFGLVIEKILWLFY